MNKQQRLELIARIEARSRVVQLPTMPTPCREWTGAVTGSLGYGYISVDGVAKRVHRIYWQCAIGRLSSRVQLLHQCDNPKCFEPNHLKPGTNKQNALERTLRERQKYKLNAAAVREIRNSELSADELAKKFGVCEWTVIQAMRRQTWRHVI